MTCSIKSAAVLQESGGGDPAVFSVYTASPSAAQGPHSPGCVSNSIDKHSACFYYLINPINILDNS